MNIRLYHPDSIVENTTGLLNKDQTHYVVNVMRLKRGSNLNFFNKNGEWESEVIFLDKERVEVKFLKKIKQPLISNEIQLAICLVKKSPMETIFQKATELGISKIIPIVSDRTEIKELNYSRAKKIVIEATEQSNQLSPPEIANITKLKDFLKNLDSNIKLLFADINSKKSLKFEDLKDKKSICILVGPEGDFTASERETILGNPGTKPFMLSRNILRSDTAVISAISLVNFINNFH